MSDYTQNVSFGPKDALTTGDPDKLIKGTEIDAELSEISTAIATKEDEANKGVADGYASLGSDGLVPNAQLPDASETVQGVVELATTAEVTTGTDTARAVTPAGVAAAITALRNSNAGIIGDLADTADPGADRILFWDESANAVQPLTVGTNLTISGTTISADEQTTTDAADLTSGTLADARVAASNVTQHQAALAIAESQITDGAILARLAANETVSGTWAFSAVPTAGGLEVGFRKMNLNDTAGTTATTAVCGQAYKATGAITVPASTFAAGDVFSIYNNTAAGLNVTQGGGLTLRWAGSSNTGSRVVAQRGWATIVFITATEATISGDIES